MLANQTAALRKTTFQIPLLNRVNSLTKAGAKVEGFTQTTKCFTKKIAKFFTKH